MGKLVEQERELLHAMAALGLDHKKPLTDEQADRVKQLFWALRKAKEYRLRREAKDPSLLAGRGRPIDQPFKKVVQSKPEDLLLAALNQREALAGQFQSQYRVGPYFSNFGFPSVKLAVEVDGRAYHTAPADQARDRRRAEYLAKLGWTLLRFKASDVTRNPMSVVDRIEVRVTGMARKVGMAAKARGG